MIEAIYSSEISVLTRATWHNIPEDGILLICLKIISMEEKEKLVAGPRMAN
jgi:hypothetical protein